MFLFVFLQMQNDARLICRLVQRLVLRAFDEGGRAALRLCEQYFLRTVSSAGRDVLLL